MLHSHIIAYNNCISKFSRLRLFCLLVGFLWQLRHINAYAKTEWILLSKYFFFLGDQHYFMDTLIRFGSEDYQQKLTN